MVGGRLEPAPRARTAGPRARRFGGCLTNLLLAAVGLAGGSVLAIRLLAPTMLARPVGVQLARELSEGMPGTLELPELRYRWGGGWGVPAARLLSAQGQTLLQGDLDWTPDAGGGGSLAVTGLVGQLRRSDAGSFDLAQALGVAGPEGTNRLRAWLREAGDGQGSEAGEQVVRVELGGGGLDLLDARGRVGGWASGELELRLGEGRLAVRGELRSPDGLGEVLRLELTVPLREGAPRWSELDGRADVRALEGGALDALAGLEGRLAAWLEGTFDLEVEASSAPSQAEARLVVGLQEGEGSLIRAQGTLSDQALFLSLAPGIARLDAGAGILSGSSGESLAQALQPEVVLDPSEDLEGRLTEGLLVWPLAGGSPILGFKVRPERFPTLSLSGAPFAPTVDSLLFELDADGRRAAYQGRLPGDLAGRFVMDLSSRSGVGPSARVELTELATAEVERALGLEGTLGPLLGEPLQVRLDRSAPGEPVRVVLSGARATLELELQGGTLRQPEGGARFLLSAADAEARAWLRRLLPWFVLASPELEVPVQLSDLRVPLAAGGATSWRASVDLRGRRLALDGALAGVLADADQRWLEEGLLEPLLVRVQGQTLTFERAEFLLGGEPVLLTGDLQLDGSSARVEASLPTPVLEPFLLGLGNLPLERARRDSRVSVEFSGPVGSERVRADLNALQRIRTFLESLLPLGG